MSTGPVACAHLCCKALSAKFLTAIETDREPLLTLQKKNWSSLKRNKEKFCSVKQMDGNI